MGITLSDTKLSIPCILYKYTSYTKNMLSLFLSKYNRYIAIMVSTMKIGEEAKKSLLKIGAEYTMKDGKERSLEDIVKILIEEHKLRQK